MVSVSHFRVSIRFITENQRFEGLDGDAGGGCALGQPKPAVDPGGQAPPMPQPQAGNTMGWEVRAA